jgi:hypothetical protein
LVIVTDQLGMLIAIIFLKFFIVMPTEGCNVSSGEDKAVGDHQAIYPPHLINMNYERFSELWDALVTNRPKAAADAVPITNGMSDETASALLEYADGNRSKIDAVKRFLASTKPA